jgi:protein-serine/threonine kinase
MIITTTTSRMPSTKNTNGDIHFHQKVKGWFTRNSSNRDRAADTTTTIHHNANAAGYGAPRSDSKSAFRQTKFWTVGRLRSATTASEGNPLDNETLSPTALANPYFAHQGQPGLRHRNEGSVPPSPPDTPSVSVNPPDDDDPNNVNEKATAARKEELARKLRRVASAPNAQGLFAKGAKGGAGGGNSTDDERPATAEMGKEPLEEGVGASALGFADNMGMGNGKATSEGGLAPPDSDGLGSLPPPPTQSALAFRRTYSSNSIKVRNVEVGPQSFDKIKLIGKGDVGKVYLVREKKSSRLYAMKGQ